jgi:uncharacterized protein
MTWIQTRTGVAFPLLDPKSDDIDLDDIAHALSMICRFTGHTRTFYSVAEHSVRVAELLPPPLKIYGLLHDAHEAYIGDISTPLRDALEHRCHGFGSELKYIKAAIDICIYAAFGLDLPTERQKAAIKNADTIMLMTEKRDLIGESPKDWGDYETSPVLPGNIIPWPQETARAVFKGQVEDELDRLHGVGKHGLAA